MSENVDIEVDEVGILGKRVVVLICRVGWGSKVLFWRYMMCRAR